MLEWAWSEQPFGEIRDPEGQVAAVIHGIALCRYDGRTEIYRFSCDERWECQQDAPCGSVAEAKAQLPRQYRRVEPVWRTSRPGGDGPSGK